MGNLGVFNRNRVFGKNPVSYEQLNQMRLTPFNHLDLNPKTTAGKFFLLLI